MASRTILVVGPAIDERAASLAVSHGFEIAYVPPYTTEESLIGIVAAVDPVGALIRMGRFGAAAIEAARSLRVIAKHGVGVDNIDVAAASLRHIPVVVAAGANARSVAEHTMALMLATVKRILPLDASLRAGRWEKAGFRGRELAGMTIGLVGFGAIARRTATLAQAFGMSVRAYDPFAGADAFAEAGVHRDRAVEDLLAASDIVSLHCPLTPETRNLMDDRRLGMMRSGSYVINTARGGLIDEAALLRAIESGQLAGAGLDSFRVEPPPGDHPFWSEPRIVVTPHVGGVTGEANARVAMDAVEGILAVVAGRELARERIVNFGALQRAHA
jgi:D-3-phosphoglycerate dehydrogenase